jgi:hypothetical protein
MNRSRRLGRVGGLAVSVAAAAPFAYLWVLQVGNAKEPLTAEVRLDMAIWMAAFGTPGVIAAQLLWRAWWRRAGVELSALDGPGWLLAAATLTSRLGLRGVDLVDGGMLSYLLFAAPLVVLAGSAAAAAAGRSFHTGLWACAWATMLGGLLIVVAWLAEAPHWYRQVGGLLLDADGGVGMGANLGDAIWWTLILMALWALPLGVLGAAAGSARARRRRAREHADPAPTA